MKRLRDISANQFLCLLLLFWTILNILQGAFTDLSGDEAYYWVISKNLDWGYYDHPPFFSWLIYPSTLLLGDTELGVRLFSILCQPLYLYLFWTLVREFRPTRKGALIYFLIAFSIPLFQLYGFVITPDTPLLLTTALVLWSYRRFLDSQGEWSQRSIIDTVLLGVSVALMAYAKYHGALIVGLIVLSNVRLLLQPKVYIAAAIALALYLPHLFWQADHNWVSFNYHLSDRMSGFDIENLWVFILNTIATFNPLLFPIFMIFAWRKGQKGRTIRKPADNQQRFEQTLSYLTWGFLAFFLYSTRNVHVQPQWLIPLCFPMLYFVFKAASTRVRMTKYIIKSSFVMLGLYIATRIFVMTYTGDLFNADIFNSEKQYSELSQKIDHRPLITNGTYMVASKNRFYNGNQGFAHPNVYRRSSQYEFLDNESNLYHKPIAIEISDSAYRTIPEAERKQRFIQHQVWHYKLSIDTISNFVPVRNVVVECNLPEKAITGQTLALDIKISNPYQWAIPLKGDDKYELYLLLRWPQFKLLQLPIDLKLDEIPAYAKINVTTNIELPANINTNTYQTGFSLIRFPYTPWFNSKTTKIHIVNPKTK